MTTKIGVVHPGAMGIFVAATIANSSHDVFWASEGRSSQTAARAREHNLTDAGTLANVCRNCDVIVSVCPPHGASDMARQVINNNFKGIYIDANAISPESLVKIGNNLQRNGIEVVDGGIIGPPNWQKSNTRIYLSGEPARNCLSFFRKGPLQAEYIGHDLGKASALKMCYAAYTKGTSALLAGILALADKHEVKDALTSRWEEDWPGLPASAATRISRSALKAWRFQGEMMEIARTFDAAGLPEDFHRGAARLYEQLAEFKNEPEPPELEAIIAKLLKRHH